MGNNKKEEKSKKEDKMSEDDEIKIADKIRGLMLRGINGLGVILFIASSYFLPVTFIVSGTCSIIEVQSDCEKILNTFEKASSALIFEILYEYANSIKDCIEYMKTIGLNKIQDDKKLNE